MLSRTNLSSGAVTTYDWNARHQLTAVHFADGNSESFRYDPLGHRDIALISGGLQLMTRLGPATGSG